MDHSTRSRFNGSANKIWVYNPDTDQYHRINYDSIDSTMNVEDDAVTYESTFGGDEVQEVLVNHLASYLVVVLSQ